MKKYTDSDRIDWLAENFFSCELDELDKKLHPNKWAWRFYAPKGIQVDIRSVLDSAMEHEGMQSDNNLKMIIKELYCALELAQNGLNWYVENSESANECDEEALRTIEEALDLVPKQLVQEFNKL